MLCKYGCGKNAIYKSRCNKIFQKCTKLKEVNSLNLKKAHKEKPDSWKGRIAWNKGLTKETDLRVLKYAISQHKNGNCTGYAKTPENELLRRKHISESCKGICGGYREGAGRTKKFYTLDSFGNKVCLQGSYEILCSQILNKLKVKWIRPVCLWYKNHTKRYFPDFFLIDYEIYLDPKNEYLIKADKDKIEQVKLENNIKLFVLSEDKLKEEYIKSLIPHMAEK